MIGCGDLLSEGAEARLVEPFRDQNRGKINGSNREDQEKY